MLTTKQSDQIKQYNIIADNYTYNNAAYLKEIATMNSRELYLLADTFNLRNDDNHAEIITELETFINNQIKSRL